MVSHPFGRSRLVVFTDLDGTLLDHDSYAWSPARPALAALKARGVPLVLASSKTAAEIAELHRALGLGDTPAIVENGAVLYRPDAAAQGRAGYTRLRAALNAVPEEIRRYFKGFGDMPVAEIAALTGLSLPDAERALRRSHSEPGLWSGSAAQLQTFLAALAASGVSARRGGRFLTLSFGASKADRMAEIASGFGADATLALGDAPNDVEMLEAADFAVIIRNDHGPGIPPLAGEATGRIRRSALPGPAGWNAAILDLLETLTPQGAPQTDG